MYDLWNDATISNFEKNLKFFPKIVSKVQYYVHAIFVDYIGWFICQGKMRYDSLATVLRVLGSLFLKMVFPV